MAYLKAVKHDPARPHSALRSPSRQLPDRVIAPRKISEQQLKNPLIRAAYKRLSNPVELRSSYLRRLDAVHGDRRTRSEKWDALSQIAEQLLVRLDLSESVLGYLDDRGRYVLNTQRRLAADSGISAPVLSRLMGTLDEAGYVYRRIERVRLDEKDEHGLHLVRTRVLIRFTRQFWSDLGLRYVFERCQKAAQKKRAATLREFAQRRSSELERRSLETVRRERLRSSWRQAEMRKAQGNPQGSQHPVMDGVEYQRQRTKMIVEIATSRGITPREAGVIADQLLQANLAKARA